MNPTNPPSVQTMLKGEFEARTNRNPKFSLRSFARFLDIPVSTLSALLSGSTNPTMTTLRKIGRKLEWPPVQISELEELTRIAKIEKSSDLNARREIKPHADLLKSQTPLALMALAKTGLLKADSQILAAALGTEPEQIASDLQLLLEMKIVYIEDEVLKIVEPAAAIIEDPDGPILKKYIAGWLTKASSQILAADPLESNAILFSIVAPKDRLELMRAKFEAFARSIRKTFPAEGACGELYCVGALVFPFKDKQARF